MGIRMLTKFKNFALRIMPGYAYIPTALVILFNIIAYYLTKLIMVNATHYDLSIFIDDMLPLVPWFISFYILAYLQWGLNYIVHSHLGREPFYHIVTADVIAKLLCTVCFIVIPTEIVRPEVTGDGIWNFLTRLIYAADTPRNLFPSVHCLESWIAFRAALMMKKAPRWYAPAQLVFSVLVFASTVLVKQHFFVDIFAGILVVEIGWFLSRRFRLWKILEKIELPPVRRERLCAACMTETKED